MGSSLVTDRSREKKMGGGDGRRTKGGGDIGRGEQGDGESEAPVLISE